ILRTREYCHRPSLLAGKQSPAGPVTLAHCRFAHQAPEFEMRCGIATSSLQMDSLCLEGEQVQCKTYVTVCFKISSSNQSAKAVPKTVAKIEKFGFSNFSR